MGSVGPDGLTSFLAPSAGGTTTRTASVLSDLASITGALEGGARSGGGDMAASTAVVRPAPPADNGGGSDTASGNGAGGAGSSTSACGTAASGGAGGRMLSAAGTTSISGRAGSARSASWTWILLLARGGNGVFLALRDQEPLEVELRDRREGRQVLERRLVDDLQAAVRLPSKSRRMPFSSSGISLRRSSSCA